MIGTIFSALVALLVGVIAFVLVSLNKFEGPGGPVIGTPAMSMRTLRGSRDDPSRAWMMATVLIGASSGRG